MIHADCITGTYVCLKKIELEDAESIIKIRNNRIINGYLPYLSDSVKEQTLWIEKQQERQNDFYFGIWNNEGFIGTIRLYNIVDNSFGEVGSFVCAGNGFESIEAKLLCHTFAFEKSGLKELYNLVREDNKKIRKINELFDVKWIDSFIDENGIKWLKGVQKKEEYFQSKAKIEAMIYRRY